MQNLIEVAALSRRFGDVHAVRGISFNVARGEVLGVLGPNGAGKTTTMRMIAGFLDPTSGTARVDGIDVQRRPVAAKRSLGYLPEGAPLYGDMTTAEFLRFIAAARGLGGSRRRGRIATIVERLSLGPVLDRRIDTLSKGFRRRVGIAQAIIHDPPVLILDEPTDGLDPNQKHEMRALIAEMAPSKAILISTHLLEEVDAVCHRALIIDGGLIRIDAAPAALRRRSAYHNAVVVTLDPAAAERLAEALRGHEDIESVSTSPLGAELAELMARPRDNRAILAQVQAAMAGLGIVPETIAVERGRLDEVFRGLTVGARADGIDTATEAAS